eukprot:scaffold253_cov243-Pinguiococcus_pyrenoidosus.AAC.4
MTNPQGSDPQAALRQGRPYHLRLIVLLEALVLPLRVEVPAEASLHAAGAPAALPRRRSRHPALKKARRVGGRVIGLLLALAEVNHVDHVFDGDAAFRNVRGHHHLPHPRIGRLLKDSALLRHGHGSVQLGVDGAPTRHEDQDGAFAHLSVDVSHQRDRHVRWPRLVVKAKGQGVRSLVRQGRQSPFHVRHAPMKIVARRGFHCVFVIHIDVGAAPGWRERRTPRLRRLGYRSRQRHRILEKAALNGMCESWDVDRRHL